MLRRKIRAFYFHVCHGRGSDQKLTFAYVWPLISHHLLQLQRDTCYKCQQLGWRRQRWRRKSHDVTSDHSHVCVTWYLMMRPSRNRSETTSHDFIGNISLGETKKYPITSYPWTRTYLNFFFQGLQSPDERHRRRYAIPLSRSEWGLEQRRHHRWRRARDPAGRRQHRRNCRHR